MVYVSLPAKDRRRLPALAKTLRDIATDPLTADMDGALFVAAAAALEAQASWMATAMPQDRYDLEKLAHVHLPVNLLV